MGGCACADTYVLSMCDHSCLFSLSFSSLSSLPPPPPFGPTPAPSPSLSLPLPYSLPLSTSPFNMTT